MTPRPLVLITGAAGMLGSWAMQELPAHGFAVRGLDVVAPAAPQDDFVQASVTDAAAVEEACRGAAAVLHLGGAAQTDASWEDCLGANIDGTRTVLEAARRAGVQRVVVASSNHATGYTPNDGTEVPADVAIRPDSLYGVSKVAIEALASWYADEYGMRTASLRIGSCRPDPIDARMLASWLSPADFRRLAVASLTAEWEGHIRVWGVSRNTRRWWSLAEGLRIGFDPQDDAEVFAAAVPPHDDRWLGGLTPTVAR